MDIRILNTELTVFASNMWKIGPIPDGDNVGKEVITQLTTDMVTNSTFYTDSNGRDFLKRVIINKFGNFDNQ